MARPPKEIDPQLVVKMASIGCSTADIGRVLGCSDQTLNRRFSDELAEGRAMMRNRLRQKQIEVALSGNTSMLIWLGKQLLDQSDRLNTTNTYSPIEVIIDGERFSDHPSPETSAVADTVLEEQGET